MDFLTILQNTKMLCMHTRYCIINGFLNNIAKHENVMHAYQVKSLLASHDHV